MKCFCSYFAFKWHWKQVWIISSWIKDLSTCLSHSFENCICNILSLARFYYIVWKKNISCSIFNWVKKRVFFSPCLLHLSNFSLSCLTAKCRWKKKSWFWKQFNFVCVFCEIEYKVMLYFISYPVIKNRILIKRE